MIFSAVDELRMEEAADAVGYLAEAVEDELPYLLDRIDWIDRTVAVGELHSVRV